MSRRVLWTLPVIALCMAMFSISAQERGGGRGAVTLPDGPGREIVQLQLRRGTRSPDHHSDTGATNG